MIHKIALGKRRQQVYDLQDDYEAQAVWRIIMKLKSFIAYLSLLVVLVLTGCKEIPAGDYDSAEVGKIKKVVPGVIVSMRPVRLHSKDLEIGMNASTSSNMDTSSNNAAINRSHGFEYVIKLNSGGIISVVQAENIKLKTRQHILVIYGRHTRVVPDNGSDDF